MQRIILSILFFIFLVAQNAFAMSSDDYLNNVEHELFAITYSSQNTSKRLDRIETEIFNKISTDTQENRIKQLYKVYAPSTFEKPAITASKPAERPKTITQTAPKTTVNPAQPADYNNYPIVSEMEKNIFSKDYNGEDIYGRLSRLEQKIFNQTYDSTALSDRVDNLKTKAMPDKTTALANNSDEVELDFNNIFAYNSSNGNIEQILSELEYGTFKKDYGSDNDEARIARLETHYFGTTSPEDIMGDRINRVASVVVANTTGQEFMPPSSKGATWGIILLNVLLIALSVLL
ncbi:MAG: hypothetical protein PHX18_06235 [Candidatus Gastranaerophilales bacterium]|nr:hypothetical protein [Candidatus Gastranaerophilales bacterium]